MARRLTTREWILVGALAAGGLGYTWYAMRSGSAVGPDAGEGEGRARLADQAPSVPMDLLARKAEDYDVSGRDLFKYSKRPPSAAELEALRRQREEQERLRAEAEQKRREVAAAKAKARDEERQQRSAVRAASGPQPPSIPLKYIGYLGPKENKIAVFEDGEDLLLARQGETVHEQFKVVEIRFETVVMGYTDPAFEAKTRELTMARK